MNVPAERWRQIEELLDQVLELPAADVPAYLDEACAGDAELRAEVEALLTAEGKAGNFLEQPAGDYAATLIDEIHTEAAQDPLEGRQLGPYRVVRQIGGGGMGVIYEATDTRLDRRVAIKLLPPALSRNPAARERFIREAKAASALDHPNICTVHDIGATEGGRMFIVMAYYSGETLEDRLEAGPLPIADARDLAIQIARGLERAHEAGIVHRDVKPANVIVTEHGEAKILDFGVAQTAGDVGLTRSGTTPGTPAFMSPEQSRGEKVDTRTDVWSLAAVLYQMITGRRPFDGKSQMAIYVAIQQHEPAPLSHWREQIPEALERAVAKCLKKDPGARYQSMTELLTVLESLAADDTRALLLHGGESASGLPEGVVVRTLMVAGLLEAPRLTEQLGDRRFTEMATAHHRMARDLSASFKGLEIESDDFLALFERPIDAAGCALAYHRGVAELTSDLDVVPEARAVIHLGEVHLRPNSPEDVARGAHPIELEGLAKPLATKLLALAGARQTLVTRGAFDLARRAGVEAPPDAQVRWIAHGDYLFDGVADPVAVYEVGALGFAPLSAPVESEDARRATGGMDTVILGWRPATGVSLPERRHWLMREKIGEGGFGEVWLASHAKTSEPRVFKFCYEAEHLKALEREVTFFRLMKEALGQRDDIVRILDWNFDQAPYYLESEYTEGGDLGQWTATQGGLAEIPFTTRIELVAQVADALAAAHSVGILHKDVKPANILIQSDRGEPRARLTDFGVGLVTDRSALPDSGVTLLGLTEDDAYLSAGTQLYMAPEILEGKVPSVQADLYALGVLLYQMVVGNFSRTLARGWQREVDDEILRDDIACFVDGSPERRPGSAQEIAERLRGLETRRAERRATERARREAEEARLALERGRRRRRILVVVAVALALFGAAMAYQVGRTQQEAARAEREAQAARQISNFLEELFVVSDPSEARGNSITAREILDRGAGQIEKELSSQPEIQARLMGVIGSVYSSLGLYETARQLSERALETRRATYGDKDPEVASSLDQLGRLFLLRGEYEEAEPRLREALAIRRQQLPSDHPDLAETLCTLGEVLTAKSRFEDAEAVLQECLSIRRQAFGEPHDAVAEALLHLGSLTHEVDPSAAEVYYRQSLAMIEGLHGDDHPSLIEVLNNYAYLLNARGDAEGAEPLFQRCVAIMRAVYGDGHHYIGIGESNLAQVLNALSRHREAEEHARRALDVFHSTFGERHWQPAITRSILGASLTGQGRYQEAEPLLTESYLLIKEQRGNEFNYAPEALERIIGLYEAWGRPEDVAANRALRQTGEP